MDDWRNDQAAIDAALADTDPANPRAIAIAEAIAGFTGRLTDQAQRTGKMPKELLLHKPATKFDDTVIRLTLQTLADELGHEIAVHWITQEAG
tara:strand:- start:992 stop:1270 length:279 start_codon:yes stop_codon:yes gene_type:complete